VERDHQQDAGQDTAWLDRLIRELEPLAEQTHDLETIVAIRHVIERHGSGPYPPEDLAALTGVDVAGVQRALDEMVRAGLAAKGDTPPAVTDS
jgi:DNA-binding MarR family transcriptional regulator